MNGSNIAGGNPERGRVENDYYATAPKDTQAFLDVVKSEYDLNGKAILEPAGGEGHIVRVLNDNYPNSNVVSTDLIDRGSDLVIGGVDFLKSRFKHYDYIITNPPFNIAKDFVDKSLQVADVSFIFAKLQLLEGKSRKDWFKDVPLKYVYVYSYRASPWRNGEEFDENGKRWASTMAFAWYVFDNNYSGEPIIRWI